MKIWKFGILLEPEFSREIPEGAEFLALQLQGSIPTMWFKVDPSSPARERKFFVVGTGHEFDGSNLYLGTFQTGPYVWHLFQKK